MNIDKIANWINERKEDWLDPPGCETNYVSSPNNSNNCCTIGIVFEHRFAFYYWAQFSKDSQEPPPVLVTIDWHNDIGVPNEVIPKDLDNLNLDERIELGFYCWTRLRSLNDGHIRPALYLNFFSDVFVLLNEYKNGFGYKDGKATPQLDNKGKKHEIIMFNDMDELLNNLPTDKPIFLDIDLDYFVRENPEKGSVKGSELLKSEDEIRGILALKGKFMKHIFPRIVGLTIALEPAYCGGIKNSLHILNILNQEFFNNTLCTDSLEWKNKECKD